jgi:hypothetical protein
MAGVPQSRLTRNATGEILSFERLQQLLATKPDAKQPTDAAISFGQDDDITVLTITRHRAGRRLSLPVFAGS